MTRQQLRQILSMGNLTGSERLILILLLLSKGEATTSQIMGKLLFHRRSVQRSCDSLRVAGMIEREPTNTNTIYKISPKLKKLLTHTKDRRVEE